MPIQQLPLMKGTGRDYRNVDYVDLLPVNMLATPKEVLGANGYLRSFPGIVKVNDVAGASRGAMYNSHESAVYRVLGTKLYRSGVEIGEVFGSKRVSMACSYNSQAIGANGLLMLFRYDGDIKYMANWPTSSGYTQYELGTLRDLCRNRSRYVWSKDGSDSFFISDLEDESKPDRYAAEYRAESQPDGIIGIDDWRDFVVCFGTKTTEYFSLTGNASAVGVAIYQAQPSMMVQKGIAGTYCKTKYADTHAIISHPATGAPSVYLINSGSVQQIATASIERILQDYTEEELSTGVMESTRFEAHELLIIHLPRHVLVYDGSVNQGGMQWTVLKTGLGDDVHSAIDYVYEGNQITCADKFSPVVGVLDKSLTSQYGQQQEHLLYTPLFKADNARAFDFELESATGVSQFAEQMFISATTDGINYGKEQLIPWNSPFRYDQRAILQRIGRIRRNIGFKIRIVTSSPVTLSGCQVRLE
ncbi:packaged DNA stabilization protein [Cronobacter malonaticus]|uniref:packaged DNA stabilization protein n=1 Tax=Cronobacter malonaticus TaxID=413503 RepID=UPI000517C4B0|nr:packaged DNA stabilization protein [Cronobacter malonaticus]MDI6469494.1 packaged DNA stabilization protein [Cronobacter malonaticus]